MDTSPGEPSTPENKVRMHLNRSFTVPTKLDISQSLTPSEVAAAEGIETLYVHPHTSIIKFTTHSITSRPGSSSGRGLPWTSPTETTIAAGSLELYRVPNTVSFLSSGNLLHAILPRSQCWCVDGVSKFAMRVFPDTYYRIELPGETKEELELVEAFKTVLGKVMHYEKTACPFQRNVDGELPELEDIRNRRLRPEDSPQWLLDRSRLRRTATANAASPKQETRSPERIVLRKRVEAPSDMPQVAPQRPEEPVRSVTAPPAMLVRPLDKSVRSPFESTSTQTTLRQFQAIPTDMPPSPPDSSAGLDNREADMLAEVYVADVAQPEAVQLAEIVTPPILEDVDSSLLSAQEGINGSLPTTDIDSAALVHGVDVESSVLLHQEDVGDSIPVRQEDVDNSVLNRQEDADSSVLIHQEDIDSSVLIHQIEDDEADAQVSTSTTEVLPAADEAEPLTLHRSVSDPDDPFAAIQARILARRSIGGTTSFYPSMVRESTSTSSVNSSSSSLSRKSNIAQQKNLAKELVRKACSAVIGPPAHLVALMLRIAARFANGTFGSMLFVESPSGSARRVPGSFQVSDEISSQESLSDDEDDFGVPLHSPVRLVAAKHLRERKVRSNSDLD